MKSSYVIGGCIIIASVVLNAKDINSLIKSTNVLGTTQGPVRLGQVNSERTMVSFVLNSGGAPLLQVEGSTADIVYLVKEKVKGMMEEENKIRTGKKKKFVLETLTFTKDIELRMTSSIVYESEYQPSFTLNLKSETKHLPEGSLFMNQLSELEKYNYNVIAKSKSLSFM